MTILPVSWHSMGGGGVLMRSPPNKTNREADAKPRLLLAIEDRWRRAGLEPFLEDSGFHLVGGAPNLVLPDAPLSPDAIFETLARLHASWPSAFLLVLVPELSARYALPCLSAGATGVLPANVEPAALVAAIHSVLAGNVWAPRHLMARALSELSRPGSAPPSEIPVSRPFTPAENRVLQAVRNGLSNKEIARLLHVSESAVKFHVSHLLRKTGKTSRHQLQNAIR